MPRVVLMPGSLPHLKGAERYHQDDLGMTLIRGHPETDLLRGPHALSEGRPSLWCLRFLVTIAHLSPYILYRLCLYLRSTHLDTLLSLGMSDFVDSLSSLRNVWRGGLKGRGAQEEAGRGNYVWYEKKERNRALGISK